MKRSEISSRYELLDALANWDKPLDDIAQDLRKYSWDYDGEPYILKPTHLRKAMQRLISGEISAQELERWANLLECREDVDFHEPHYEKVSQTIYRLANPTLEGSITLADCRDLIDELEGKNQGQGSGSGLES